MQEFEQDEIIRIRIGTGRDNAIRRMVGRFRNDPTRKPYLLFRTIILHDHNQASWDIHHNAFATLMMRQVRYLRVNLRHRPCVDLHGTIAKILSDQRITCCLQRF